MPKRDRSAATPPPADDPWEGGTPIDETTPASEPETSAAASAETTETNPPATAEESETPAPAARRRRRAAPAAAGEEAAKPTARKPKAADARGFEFEDVNTDDIEFESMEDADEYISALYYGHEGTIKTTSALQATNLPDKGMVLLVNAEGGAKRSALEGRGVDVSRVQMWPPRGQRVSHAGLEKLFYRLAADLRKDKDSWAAVVWDSGTEIVQSLLDQVVEKEYAEQEEILAATQGRAGNIKLRDRFDNDRDDYRIMSNQVRSLIRKFRYLPCHFIMTALLRTDINDKTKAITSIGPAVTPALQTDILGYVDVVAFAKATTGADGERVFYAQTYPEGKERAKDRFDKLPSELVQPGFDRIVAYVRGELTAENDPIQNALPGANEARKPAAKTERPPRAGRRSRAKEEAAEAVPELPEAETEEVATETATADVPAPTTKATEAKARATVKEELKDKDPAARSARRASRASRPARNAAKNAERPAATGFQDDPPF